MVRVTIEIVPFGIEEKKRTIGRMIIGLRPVADRAANYGDYDVTIETDKMGTLAVTDKFEVLGHYRPRGVFELLRRCFTQAGPALTAKEER